MALIKFVTKNAKGSPYTDKYKDDAALNCLTEYAENYNKSYGDVGGWAVDVRNAVTEMELLSSLYHKNCGVRLRHWLISLAWYELEKVASLMGQSEAEAMLTLGYWLSSYYKNRYQIVFGVHWDKANHPHIHFVMNNVSYVDGYKFTGSKEAYYDYIDYVRRVLHQYGLILYVNSDHTAPMPSYLSD